MIYFFKVIPSKMMDITALYHPPLGLLYVASGLEKYNFNCDIFQIGEFEIDKYVNKIVKDKPDYVGFSVMTGMSSYYTIEMAKKIKEKLPEMSIVWGGHHGNYLAKQVLQENLVNYVVIGEGEITTAELSDYIINKKGNLNNIKGIGYKDEKNNIIQTEARELLTNIDDYNPAWHKIDIEKFIIKNKGMRIFSFYSSRGCYRFPRQRDRPQMIQTAASFHHYP